MYWRWTALVGLAVVLAPLTASAENVQGSPLADTEFNDWTGVLKETTLSDGSVLSEYVARTRSQDAFIEVAFVPRFGCTPSLRIIVPEQGGSDPQSEEAQIRISIDGTPYDFPALVDVGSVSIEYSYLADHSTQQDMRLLLDRSSHLLLQRGTTAASQAVLADDQTDTAINFSLLGSRLSVEAVESYCQTHNPILFELSESD